MPSLPHQTTYTLPSQRIVNDVDCLFFKTGVQCATLLPHKLAVAINLNPFNTFLYETLAYDINR